MCAGNKTICKLCFTVTKTEDSIEILSDKGIEANIESVIALHLSSLVSSLLKKNPDLSKFCLL